jgi:DNA-directed RNA polymerase specialized sigma24 family protein
MKPAHLAKITSNARALVCRHRHLAWRLSLGDLEQEALLAQVDASTRFDDARGTPFGAYTWRAAVIAAYRYVLTDSAPVSGRHDPQVLIGLYREEYVEAQHEGGGSQEDELGRAEWSQLVRQRLDAVIGDGGAEFVTQMLTGEYKPADVAEAHGVEIAEVYKAVREAKKKISGDPELFELWRNM